MHFSNFFISGQTGKKCYSFGYDYNANVSSKIQFVGNKIQNRKYVIEIKKPHKQWTYKTINLAPGILLYASIFLDILMVLQK